jgi:hypothetical protein
MSNFEPHHYEQIDRLRHADHISKLDFIQELIVELHWSPRHKRELAQSWRMSALDVHRMGCEAQGLIMTAMRDPDELRAAIVGKMNYVVETAVHKKRAILDKDGNVVMVPDPDLKAAVAGLGQIARITGIDKTPPSRVVKDYQRMDLQQLLEVAQRKLLPEGGAPKDLDDRQQDQQERRQPRRRPEHQQELLAQGTPVVPEEPEDPLPNPT